MLSIAYTYFVLCLFAHQGLAITQTLTTSDQNRWVNGASVINLSPATTVVANSNWHLTANGNSQWNLGLKTNRTWGIHATLPSSFSVQLSGATDTSPSNLLISFADNADTKYFTILISLNNQNHHLIAPGCDSNHNPTQRFIHGAVQRTLTDQPGTRKCRPAYINSSHRCPYTTFGAATTILWPMTFTLRMYPIAGYSTITFEADGYSAIPCAFGEVFPPNIGTSVWITTLASNNIDISSIQLDYTVLSPPTIEPSSIHGPTVQLAVTSSPTENIATKASTIEATAAFKDVDFWQRKSAVPVIIAIAIATCTVLLLCMVACCYYVCKKIKACCDAAQGKEYSVKMSFSVERLFMSSRSRTARKRTGAVSPSRHQLKEYSHSTSEDSRGVPIPDAIDMDVAMVHPPQVTITRGTLREGTETMDEIDTLYGKEHPRHRKAQSTQVTLLTDIESMYNSVSSPKGVDGMDTGRGDQKLEEKDGIYDEPSVVVQDGVGTRESETQTTVPKGNRVFHDTHGTSISLSVAVYEDNESKEDYYVDDEEEEDVDHTEIITKQLSAITESPNGMSCK